MSVDLPGLKRNMLVTTPNSRLKDITPEINYVIEDIDRGENKIFVRNDSGLLCSYSSLEFIESDVYFTLTLYVFIEKLLS